MANIFRAKSLISRTGVFSNEVLSPNLVYNTGDQNISGVKNFYSRPTVNGTGVLLSGEAANLPDTIVYTSGNQTISGIKTFDIAPVVSGNSLITGNLSLYATSVNLANTGSTLNTKINTLSGVSVLTYGNQNIAGNKTFINNIEVQGTGIFNALDLSNISDFSFSGVTINLIDSTVQSSGQIYISGNPVSTGTVILPNTIVYTTGDQIISGIKDFYDQLRTFGDVDLNYAPSTNKRIRIWTTGLSAGAPIPFIGTLIDISGIYIQNGMVLKINDVEVTPSLYATIDNLASTGLNLSNSIDSLSGLFTGYTGNLDATFATDIQLFNTGSTLDTKIDTLSGSAVLLYGNQTVDGLKDFTTRPTVNTTPVLLSGENANGLTVLVKNDESTTLLKGQPVYIYGANGANILVRKASNTGEAYSSKTLGLLAQDLTSNAQGLVITEGSLEGINTDAGNAGDPIWLGPTGDLIFGTANKPYGVNHLVYLGVIERKQANNGKIYVKVQNGFELEELHNVDINHRYSLSNDDVLRYDSASGIWYNRPINTGIFQTQISSLSGTLTSDYATIINLALTGNTLTTNLGNTGLNLNNSINSLSGVSVLTYGNQSITGNKTFINNITVSGTGTFNAIDLDNIDNLSLSGVDVTLINSNVNVSGNIFISGNPVLTGVNLTPYATTVNLALTGLNLSNNINSLSGLFTGYTGNLDSTFASDTQLTNTGITLVNSISSLSGTLTNDYLTTSSASSTYATITNLALTGSTLQTNINNLSNTYATITNVGLTGVTLNTRINNLSGYINSTSSNIVFTTGNQIISGFKTFVQDATFGDTGQGDFLVISGNNFTVYGSGNFTSGLFVSGSPVLTGSSTLYATTANLALTGSTLQTNINNLSNTYATITNVALTGSTLSTNIASTGSTLQTNINNLSNTYATITNLALTGSTLVNNITSLSGLFTGYTGTLDATYATDIQVLNTGITLNTRINNLSGYVNSTSSNIVFTTGNQNIAGNKTFTGVVTFSGQEVNIIDTALNLSGLGDMTFSGTNINFINSPVFISGTNLRVIGDVLGNNLVYKTGNQTISGNKTFATGVNISGNVGIGTITPFAKLHIAGPPALLNTTMEDVLYLQRPFNAGVAFGSRAVLRLGKYTSDGSQSFTRLDIALRSGSDDTTISNPPEINVMTLRADGSVGIGTTTPNERLTVIGNANVSGNMLLSGTLTTNQRPFVNGTGVLLSGEAAQVDLSTTIRTTGNQTVSGVKDFQSVPLVSGREVYYQKNIVYSTGNNFTPDSNTARTFEYVLTGLAGASATLNAPINMSNGENIVIKIKQSANGSNNIIFNANYKFPGGVIPSLTLTPSKADIYTILKIDSNFYSTYVKDFIN